MKADLNKLIPCLFMFSRLRTLLYYKYLTAKQIPCNKLDQLTCLIPRGKIIFHTLYT